MQQYTRDQIRAAFAEWLARLHDQSSPPTVAADLRLVEDADELADQLVALVP